MRNALFLVGLLMGAAFVEQRLSIQGEGEFPRRLGRDGFAIVDESAWDGSTRVTFAR
jgi:hypothetical protein